MNPFTAFIPAYHMCAQVQTHVYIRCEVLMNDFRFYSSRKIYHLPSAMVYAFRFPAAGEVHILNEARKRGVRDSQVGDSSYPAYLP